MSTEPTHADGNLLAGPLADVFADHNPAPPPTGGGCGREDRVADLHVYAVGEAYVARCPGCQDAVLRYLRTATRAVLDLRGTLALRVPVAAT